MKDQFLFLFLFFFLACNGQTTIPSNANKIVGGPFENREFMYIGMPEQITSVDTSKAWAVEGQKISITGKILQQDGKTPAPNVILYYYHTDVSGLYSANDDLDKRILRHGYIRGWVKSDANGNYSIYTVKPGAYPNRTDPAHIHITVKEPKLNEYWIDNFVFDDDPLLTNAKRKALLNRGGSGVLKLLQKDELQVAEHNIILGLNIPNYREMIRQNLLQ